MNNEIANSLNLIKEEKRKAIFKQYELANNFRAKINKLINTTPTGELRNELTELNILFESFLANENLLRKLKGEN